MNPKDVDVRALAKLARLHVSDAELEKLAEELPSILAFVETVQNAAISNEVVAPPLRNVMRTDDHPHESGVYTERILDAAPAHEKGKVVVKQVLSRKR